PLRSRRCSPGYSQVPASGCLSRGDDKPMARGAVEQQDAADEVRASRWRPSQLILVLGRPNMTPPRVLFLLLVLTVAGCDTMIADRFHVCVATGPPGSEAASSRALTVVRDALAASGLERVPGPGPEQWWWNNPDTGPGVHATLHPHPAGVDVRLS